MCVIYAGVNGYLDKMETSEIPNFEKKFLEYMKSNNPTLMEEIRSTGILTDE